MRRTHRLLSALASCGVVACASVGGNGRGIEVAGTPSRSGCDASFEISDFRNGIHFTLVNTSKSDNCKATQVTLVFESGVRRDVRDVMQVSTPTGWKVQDALCESGDGVCGVVWRAEVGLPAGESLSGFRIACDPRRLESWIVDVGRRRVTTPIGQVGGRFVPPPPEAPPNKGMS